MKYFSYQIKLFAKYFVAGVLFVILFTTPFVKSGDSGNELSTHLILSMPDDLHKLISA